VHNESERQVDAFYAQLISEIHNNRLLIVSTLIKGSYTGTTSFIYIYTGTEQSLYSDPEEK
jgi:hypothetical protein